MESRVSRFLSAEPEVGGLSIDQETISIFERDRREVENVWYTSDDNSDLELEGVGDSDERNREKNWETSRRELADLAEESEDGDDEKYEVETSEIDSNDEAVDKEEFYSTDSSSTGEKFGDETASNSDENSIDLLTGSLAEILRDRRATIDKLGELRRVSPELRRKNRFLQFRVIRVMSKKHQTMTPEDEVSEVSEDRYARQLIHCWESTIVEIEARKSHVQAELNLLEYSLKSRLDEDSRVLGEFVDREREIGAGLVLEKSGRVMIGPKVVDAMIRRQILRRESMNRHRFGYIRLRHRLEDLRTKLRLVETLGPGMTVMDYEALAMVNYGHRDKLEERERDLEKLYIKAQTLLNALNNYKERHIVNQSSIYHNSRRLEIVKSELLAARCECTKIRRRLSRLREICAIRKRRGGLIFAIPVVREMEKTLETLNDLEIEIARMTQYPPEEKIQSSATPSTVMATGKLRSDGARATVAIMTKIGRSGMRSSPGRC